MIDRLHLYLITIVAFVGVFFAGRFVEWDKIRIEQKAAAVEHEQELDTARHSHDQEIVDLRNAKPLPAVRLCNHVQAGKAADTGVSPPADVGAAVHDGDHSVRAGDDHPDIGNLLTAYAAIFAAKNVDLREQQAVK